MAESFNLQKARAFEHCQEYEHCDAGGIIEAACEEIERLRADVDGLVEALAGDDGDVAVNVCINSREQAKRIQELEQELTTLRLSDVGHWKAEYDRIYHSFVLERKRNFVYWEILEKKKATGEVREMLESRGLIGAWPPVVNGEVERIKKLEAALLEAEAIRIYGEYDIFDWPQMGDDMRKPFYDAAYAELHKAGLL